MPRAKRPESEHNQAVTISFEPEQLKALLEYCQRNERSMSWVIRKALEKWLKEHENDFI